MVDLPEVTSAQNEQVGTERAADASKNIGCGCETMTWGSPFSSARLSGSSARSPLSDHLLANVGRVDTEAYEDLRGDSSTVTDDAKQDVPSTDVIVAELCASRRESSRAARGVKGIIPVGSWPTPARRRKA
jgi:hypothetical protein